MQCVMCGKSFEVRRYKVKTGEQLTCCGKCQSDFHSIWQKNFYSDPVNREKVSARSQGISYEEWEGFAKDHPYCPLFDETCRESNRDKYDRKCFLCGKDESENTTSTDKHRKLSVHHFDMQKMAGCGGHEWKLVPLCIHCHANAHNCLTTDRITYLLNNVWNKV